MDNDPKLKVRAYALAAQFDSQPLKWRVDPDGAFVLILMDGRKMKFDQEQTNAAEIQREAKIEAKAEHDSGKPSPKKKKKKDQATDGAIFPA